jgi:hypothetical protein
MVKRRIKKGELTPLDDSVFNEIFDEVEQDMEDYRINENYRKGMSRIEIEKTPTLHDYFLSITPKITI